MKTPTTSDTCSLLSTALLGIGLLVAPGRSCAAEASPAAHDGRWTTEHAWTWYRSQPWLIGFNYIPAAAINTTEMWQRNTFDPKTIDSELALAEQIGFNCARVFVQYLVWENDAQGLEKRLDQFLALAHRHGFRTVFVLFDECAFSTMTEPFLGKQPDVLPGEYANGWIPSPGPKRVLDRSAWPKLEAYVRAVVGRFRSDPRVLAWDVYNEPSNTGMGNKSLPLVEAAFAWARQADPSQPLTVAVWGGTPESTRACLELSDVISFHCYGKAPELERKIKELQGELRPILCTEWLNRPLGSLAETCLPVLARERVGAFHWGLVNGKTQTQFPWGSKAGAAEPKVWQHDLFRKDHSPYDEKELALFRETIRRASGGVPPKQPPAAPASDSAGPAGIWDRQNLTAWCVVPFDARERGPEERAQMLHRLGFRNFAYDWRPKDVPAFDAEVEAMEAHGIRLVAWWFPTDAADPTARTILEVIKRHGIHPQLWVMGGGPPTRTEQDQQQRVEQEAERIRKMVELAAPYGCQVELYNHNGWFGQPDNEVAVIERLKQAGVTNVGMIYNFSHGHADVAQFPAIWKRIQPYVVAVNVTGMVMTEKLIPPSQGDHELDMLRTIQQSGWRGPVGLIAEQGGAAEVTLSNNLRGLDWLRKELAKPGSGGPRPQLP